MTPEPRFLALVAKVDEQADFLMRRIENDCSEEMVEAGWSLIRALKGEIMRHEPYISVDGGVYCATCLTDEALDGTLRTLWPCKPFLDMESEVGK